MWYWWDSQLFLVKWKQKLVSTMKIPETTKSFGSNTFNKLNHFHQKTNWVNFCQEARFMRVVEVGQYFVIKDTGDFRQFQSVACREHTLPRDDKASQAKGWIQGNTRIGPVLEITTSFQHFKYGIEIRIKSVNQDDFHSWVTISHGTVKLCERFYWRQYRKSCRSTRRGKSTNKLECGCSQVKWKSKTLNRGNLLAQQLYHYVKKWIDIEPSKQDLELYDLSKKVINLLRHNQKLQREEDGAIEFCKIKFHLRNHQSQIQKWSDDRWKACWVAGGGSKRRYQYCSELFIAVLFKDILEAISLILRYRTTCWLEQEYSLTITTLDAHSIFILLLPMDWYLEVKFEQKTNSVLLARWSKRWKSQRPWICWLLLTSLYHVSNDTCTVHVFWVDIDLSIREGLTFYQTRSNAFFLHGTLPAHCIVKVERLKSGEKCCMKDNIWLLVHRRRSLWNTISIGHKEMIRVLQLNIHQLENSFNSHLEKHFKLVLPSQPNSLNPLKIVRGNLCPKRLLVVARRT